MCFFNSTLKNVRSREELKQFTGVTFQSTGLVVMGRGGLLVLGGMHHDP